jgi:hypothetical protein
MNTSTLLSPHHIGYIQPEAIPTVDWKADLAEDERRRLEAIERKERDARLDAQDSGRAARETQNLQVNRNLMWAAIGSAVVAILATGAAFWQGYESHQARKDAQTDFVITRKDAADSAEQARQDTLDQFKQQLDAQHALRDQAARSATAASVAAFSAKAQTEIMGKQMALTQQIERPWIGIDGDIVPRWQAPVKSVQGEFPSLSIAAPVQLRNFGQRLARRVKAQFKLDDSPVSLMAREAHWREAAKPLCDEAEKQSLDENQTAVVIFPGSPAPAPFEAGFYLGSFSYQHNVLALGCIVYREQGAETIHHTRTLYRAEFGQQKQDVSFPVGFYQEIARFTPLDVDAD